MTEAVANFAQSSLNGAINATATTITLNDGTTFPSSGQFRIRIDDELIICTRSGVTLSVVGGVSGRGTEGTIAVSHSDTTAVYGPLTKAGLDAYIPQQATGTAVGGQATGTVGAMTITDSHGTSGTLTHHAQTHTVSDHTTAITVSDEGVSQGNVKTVDFTGSGVSASVAGTTATVTVTGGGGGSSGPPTGGAVLVGSQDMPPTVQAICDYVAGASNAATNINTALNVAAAISARQSPGTPADTVGGAVQRGMVQLTGGRFTMAGPALIRSGETLNGMGNLTDVRATTSTFTDAGSGTETALIKMFDGTQHMFTISNLLLGGASSAGSVQHGIYLCGTNNTSGAYPSTGSGDQVPRIEDFWIEAFPDSGSCGIKFANTSGNGALRAFFIGHGRIRNCFTGISMANCPDGSIHDIHAGGTGCSIGFDISSPNVKMTHLKAWYCSTYGYNMNGNRCVGASLEAQDSATGFYFNAAPGAWSSLLAETCLNDGILISASDVQIYGFKIESRGSSGLYATQATGMRFDGPYQDLMLLGTISVANITAPISGTAPTVSGRNWARIRTDVSVASSPFEPTIGGGILPGGLYVGN